MLGIIPAAGSATRFNGQYKEFLRLHNGAFLLDNAFRTLDQFGANEYLLISNHEKIHKHATHLQLFAGEYLSKTQFMLQQDYSDMWQAIRMTLPYAHELNMLVLPDTYWTVGPNDLDYKDIIFGTFTTNRSSQFSLVHNNTIITKPENLEGWYHAWGTVLWYNHVADFWMRRERYFGDYVTYDDAFRDAMQEFGYSTFPIDQYYDFASQEAYDTFLGLDK